MKSLCEIITNEDFDIDNDFKQIYSSKEKGYSTQETMVDLEYDVQDVIDRLGELCMEEYSETLFDKDDTNPPLLFVFGKSINKKLVYIKLKIRKNADNREIVCVSFHYALRDMNFPYR